MSFYNNFINFMLSCFLSCFLKVQGELHLLQNMKLAIPIFHSYGHKTQCQVLFLTSFYFFQYLLYQLKCPWDENFIFHLIAFSCRI